MKVAVIADCHLNKSNYKSAMVNGVPFRNLDFMNSFSFMCNECINTIKPDLMVLNGDTYDTDNPSNTIRAFLNSWLESLNRANIPVIILVGNHDICKNHFPLQPLKALDLKYVKVVDTPCTHKFKGFRLLLFPYSLDVERQKVKIRDEFHSFVEQSKKENDLPKIFFGHFGVQGAKINTYTEDNEELSNLDISTQKDILGRGENTITMDDLDSIGAEYVFLGDYHKFQVLPTKKCISMYSGSIERTDITEKDHDKGFIVYDSDAQVNKEMGKCTFIKYTNCRPMLEVKGTMEKIKQQLSEVDANKYKDAIVKIYFVGNNNEKLEYVSGYDELVKDITSKLHPIYLYDVKKVTDDELEQKATELEKEILSKGHFEDIDVISIVKEVIKEKETPEESEKMGKIVDEIWDSVKIEMEG